MPAGAESCSLLAADAPLACLLDYDDISNQIDFIICLGGDGTLLYASSLFQVSPCGLTPLPPSRCRTAQGASGLSVCRMLGADSQRLSVVLELGEGPWGGPSRAWGSGPWVAPEGRACTGAQWAVLSPEPTSLLHGPARGQRSGLEAVERALLALLTSVVTSHGLAPPLQALALGSMWSATR